MKPLLFYILIFLGSASIYSQTTPDSSQSAAFEKLLDSYNTISVHWDKNTGTPDIINFSQPISFDKDEKKSAENFFKEIKELLKLRPEKDKFQVKAIKEKRKAKYIRYSQLYKGLPVLNGEYVFTFQANGKIQSVLGTFYKDIDVNTTPDILLQDAFGKALQDEKNNRKLRDSLASSKLLIFPKDKTYHLAWELKIPKLYATGLWVYYIDAHSGEILADYDEVVSECLLLPNSYANYFPRHPSLDGSYSTISNIPNLSSTGYLSGTYANILNYAGARAYSATYDFRYSTNDLHFDEANLYYHIDKFRTNFWSSLDDVFDAVGQMTAKANYSDPLNAYYDPASDQLYFGNANGYPGYNSFAREDKVIYHEYTHAVTYNVAGLGSGYNETGAINEGNSDYFAGTFTGRSLIGEYCSPSNTRNQRDMTSPRISNYSTYTGTNWGYPYVEPHDGGELWSATLWDLRGNLGSSVANWIIYDGLFGISSSTTFAQYRQSIINSDANYFNGIYGKKIRHIFYNRGIGYDSTSVAISGPSELGFRQTGTYTANPSGGSGSFTYQWYSSYDNGVTWYTAGTTRSTTFFMFDQSYMIRCDAHDTQTGEMATRKMTIYYADDLFKRGLASNTANQPKYFMLSQNNPNPFNPTTTINYQIAENGFVNITVYDILGNKI